MKVVWAVAIIAQIYFVCVACENINMTKYYKLPPIFEFDDYDRCLTEHPENKSTYCYVDVTLRPNTSSDIWNYAAILNQDEKHNYRHDRLKRGVCLNWCQNELRDVVKIVQRHFLQPRSEMVVNDTTLSDTLFQNAMDHRIKYNRFINICVNRRLWPKYYLMAYSEIEYCVTSSDPKTLDKLDYICVTVIGLIIACVIASSQYDYKLQRRTKSLGHYNEPLVNKTDQILTAFSISRNWEKLLAPSNPPELKILTSCKTFFLSGIMLSHVMLVNIVLPVRNTDYIEKSMQKVETAMLSNGSLLMQSYFAISGILVGYHFFTTVVMNGERFKLFYGPWAVINRLLRFLPTYLFVILLHSTLLLHMQDGPVWPYISESERNSCRKNWWANLLFINNYVTANEPCMQHAWYLAVDLQLFTASIVLLMITWRFPKTLAPIFVTTIGLSMVSIAVITYVNAFDGAADMHTIEQLRFLNLRNPMYLKMYIVTHTCFGNYWIGILGGFLMVQLKKRNFKVKTMARYKQVKLLWCACIPLAVGIVISGYFFYAYEFKKPAVWIAIYATVTRHVFGLFTVFTALGFIYNFGGVFRKIILHKFFIILGRTTFSVYVLHALIIRTIEASRREPEYLSDYTVGMKCVANVVVCFLAGLALSLTVEYPFGNLQKIIMQSNQKLNKSKNNTPAEGLSTNNNNNAEGVQMQLTEMK